MTVSGGRRPAGVAHSRVGFDTAISRIDELRSATVALVQQARRAAKENTHAH